MAEDGRNQHGSNIYQIDPHFHFPSFVTESMNLWVICLDLVLIVATRDG